METPKYIQIEMPLNDDKGKTDITELEYYKAVTHDASKQFHEMQVRYNKVRLDLINCEERLEQKKTQYFNIKRDYEYLVSKIENFRKYEYLMERIVFDILPNDREVLTIQEENEANKKLCTLLFEENTQLQLKVKGLEDALSSFKSNKL